MGSSHGIGIKRNDHHRRNRRANISMHSKSAGTNTESAFLRILNTPIEVPTIERDRLIDLAKKQKSAFRKQAMVDINPTGSYAASLCVNFLRHEFSPYESLLRSRKWQNQNRETYLLVFKRVMDAIAKANPWLADECDHQYQEKSGAAFSLRKHVRVVKGGGLTSLHVQEHNEREQAAFTGIEEEYEPSGYIGEDDGSWRDPALTSLASTRLLYMPPFLKPEEIRKRRFDGSLQMNDRWWEWEEEKQLRIPEREQRFNWTT